MLAANHTGLSMAEMTKKLAELWKGMNASQKATYEVCAIAIIRRLHVCAGRLHAMSLLNTDELLSFTCALCVPAKLTAQHLQLP